MKKIVFLLVLLFSFSVSSLCFAADWEKSFISKLTEGKKQTTTNSGGLAYTPPEEVALEVAISEALEQKAPPCEVVKIAVDLEYNPYLILLNIFGYGGEVNLDQLCMCATETGVSKQIVAKAVKDALTPLNKPVFARDEITQSQCLNEGLGYTESFDGPSPIDPPPVPNPISPSKPI